MLHNIFIILPTLLLNAGLYAQDTWQRTYGGWGIDEGRYIAETSDQGLIVVGSTGSFGAGASDVYVLKLSSSGHREWSTALGGIGIDQGWAAREVASGGYLVIGCTNGEGGSYDGRLIRLDEGGGVLWDHTYGGNDWDFLYDLEIVDNGIVMVGSTTVNGNMVGWLVWADHEGGIVGQMTFGGPLWTEMRAVRSTSDGGLVLVGTKALTDSTHGAWVIRLDSNGEESWNTVLGAYPKSVGYSIVETEDGGFVIGGYGIEPPARHVMMVAKADADGNPLWVNHVDGGEGEWEGRSIRERSDGSLVLAGNTTSYGAGGVDCYMAILDEQGQWVSGPSFGSEGDEDCWGLTLTSDGGYVLVGSTRGIGPGVSAVYVVKNAGGIIEDPFVEDFDPLMVQLQKQEKRLMLAPNPIRGGDIIYITWPDSYLGPWVADIFSMDGRVIRQVTGTPGECEIPITRSKPGTYLLRLMWGEGSVTMVPVIVYAE